ncbi:MAG: hypothetical protein COW10_06150, partial [Candidatus Omnitrophica bacterium CG12_big_fil_rev_8_21_14_0_65_42_8]
KKAGSAEITTVRKDIFYNELGLIKKYTDIIKSTATLDLTTTVEFEALSFNNDNKIAEYNEKKTDTGSMVNGDTLNSITTTHRKDIEYYSGTSQLKRYQDVITYNYAQDLTVTVTMDIAEHNKNGVRLSDGGYNALGQMVSYKEINNEKGNAIYNGFNIGVDFTVTSVRLSAGTKYDQYSRITDYNDITFSISGVTDRSLTDMSYNNVTGQTIYYKQLDTVSGITNITQRWISGFSYDAAGDVRFNTNGGTATLLDDVPIILNPAAGYNTLGQMTEYVEVITSSTDSIRRVIAWKDARYLPTSQLSYYKEITKEQGLDPATGRIAIDPDTDEPSYYSRKVSTRHDIGYNTLNQMESYYEEITEKSNVLGITFSKHVTGMFYDIVKQVAAYYEVENITGTSAADSTYINITKTTRKEADPSVDFYAVTDISDPDHRKIKGMLKQYKETVSQVSNPGSGIEINLTTETVRSGITYNSNFQITYYKDINTSTATPNLSVTTYFGDNDANPNNGMQVPVYGSNDKRLQSFYEYKIEKDIATNGAALNITTLTNRHDMQYNSFNQLIAYIDEITKSGIKTITSRLESQYNSDGQIIYSKEDIIAESTPDLKTTVYFGGYVKDTGVLNKSAPKFDVLGRVVYSDEYRIEYDTKQLQGVNSLNLGVRITRQTAAFDAAGGIVAGSGYNDKSQVISTVETTDKQGQSKTVDYKRGIKYNDLGQVYYSLNSTTFTEGSAALKSDVYFGDEDENAANNGSQKDRYVKYDKQGRMTWYKEYRVDQDVSPADNLTVRIQTTRTGKEAIGADYQANQGIEYDLATGQILSYQDIVINKDASKDLITTTKRAFGNYDFDASGNLVDIGGKGYNALGQATGYYEIANEKDTTGQNRVDYTTITIRDKSQTRYDKYGRLVNYRDRVMSPTGLITDKITTGVTYNYNTGKMTGYREELVSDGVITIKERVINAITGYNELGHLVSYTEDSWQVPDAGKNETILRKTTWSEGQYYKTGLLKSYTEINQDYSYTYDYANNSPGVELPDYYSKIRTERTLPGYNTLGQTSSY